MKKETWKVVIQILIKKKPHDTVEWSNSHDMAMLMQAMCIFESNYRPELSYLEQIHRDMMNIRRVQQ